MELYNSQSFYGFFKNKSFILYPRPSDSIHIEIDRINFLKEPSPIFKISGTSLDAEISKEIQKYIQFTLCENIENESIRLK